MSHRVTVAVMAADLPPFEPPLGLSGFDTPYDERVRVELEVEGSTTLEEIYRRAIEELQPRVARVWPSELADPRDVVRWAWFYEPEDAQGIDERKVYELPEDLVLVEADGTARWNLTPAEITVDHLLRSAERGLLRGDPLRPYLVLLLPQGGEAWQTAWDVAVTAWNVLAQLLTAREAIKLAHGVVRDRLRGRVEEGVDVVRRHQDRWAAAGGGPSQVLRTLERRPWTLDELRMVLGITSEEDAAKLMTLMGFAQGADDRYALSHDEELALLHEIGWEAGVGGFDAARPEWAQRRIAKTLESGQLPSRIDDLEE